MLPLFVMTRYNGEGLSLTLEELKRQINIDYNDDDDYIQALGDAAASQVLHATRRSIEELLELGGGDYPRELRLAALQLAAHWYRMREAVASTNQVAVPFGINFLVKPFVKLVSDD